MNKGSAERFASLLFWRAVDIGLYGVALKFLWVWFGQPTFGTAPLTWPTAFGLVLTARLLGRRDEAGDRQVTFQNLVYEALAPALFIGVGYGIHRFLGP